MTQNFYKVFQRKLIIATGLLKQYIPKQYIHIFYNIYIQVVFYEINLAVLLESMVFWNLLCLIFPITIV